MTVGRRAPSSRFRILQYEERLRAAGVDPVFRPADAGHGRFAQWLSRAWELRNVDRWSVLFLQKPNYLLYPRDATRMLDRLPNELVFDFDDAVYIDPASGALREKRVLDAIHYLLGRSRTVTVGNAHLAEFASRFAKSVRIIPTAIDTDRWYPAEEHGNAGNEREVVIGWIGSRQNLSELAAIREPLLAVLSRHPCRLHVISNANMSQFIGASGLRHPNVHCFPWSEKSELRLLAEIDVGLMPLRASPYALGKCGFKIVQYMALGKPAVASTVGANNEIIEHGVSGFLVTAAKAWQDAMETLVADVACRRAMGRAARDRAVARFSLHAVFPLLLRAIRPMPS